ELHAKLFGQEFAEAHNATADVEATARCFWELVRIRHWQPSQLGVQSAQLEDFIAANPQMVSPIGLSHRNLKAASAALKARDSAPAAPAAAPDAAGSDQDTPFFHLHVHSQFSVLQATTKVPELIKRVTADGQPAVALTDLGNMMGAFQFVQGVQAYNKNRPEDSPELKAIVGMDAYVCRNHLDRSQKDDGYQIPLLAKNKTGYHNLAKLSSIAYIEGFYYVPRIDRDLLLAHKEGVMVTTGGMMGEVPQLILNVGEKQAEEAFLWWKSQFGADFYAEINRHGLPEEDAVNEVLRRFCAAHGVKAVAANNAFYLDEAQAEAHDILLCVKESEKKATPIGRGRGFRYGFPNSKFYLTTQAEMRQRFADWPEALVNLGEILEKVENFGLARDVLLPAFEIPQEFVHPDDARDGGKRGENAYLRHLTYVGAKKRWGDPVPAEIAERLDFELETIERTGYPGYFLIVQDFCQAARDMGVSVGPGRGSAAGSAVAYATGITNVDPITYDLLFERFLNPDRVSLPDIDIDFDDRAATR
ncbi:MAG: polymerase subunit alpha, partial [Bacteroidota bacterium]